jgi:N-(2-amino-2-carboxyethyl)-L-glutamate synthase
MPEIVEALDGDVDYVFYATSTCGTLRGCAEYVCAQQLRTKVVAVDAAGSAIFGDAHAPRIIPGLGAGIVPALFSSDLADLHVHVTDLDCVVGCRRLVQREAILVGGSSGGVATAVERLRSSLPDGARCDS